MVQGRLFPGVREIHFRCSGGRAYGAPMLHFRLKKEIRVDFA